MSHLATRPARPIGSHARGRARRAVALIAFACMVGSPPVLAASPSSPALLAGCSTLQKPGTWVLNQYASAFPTAGPPVWCRRPGKYSVDLVPNDGDDWGGGSFSRLRWTNWGEAKTVGKGRFDWGRMGVYGRAAVTITLSGRVATCFRRNHVYTRIRIEIDSDEWPGVRRGTLYQPFCDVG